MKMQDDAHYYKYLSIKDVTLKQFSLSLEFITYVKLCEANLMNLKVPSKKISQAFCLLHHLILASCLTF